MPSPQPYGLPYPQLSTQASSSSRPIAQQSAPPQSPAIGLPRPPPFASHAPESRSSNAPPSIPYDPNAQTSSHSVSNPTLQSHPSARYGSDPTYLQSPSDDEPRCLGAYGPDRKPIDPSRLPPRPPTFSALSDSAGGNQYDVPRSLQPGLFLRGTASVSKVPYDWELAPQPTERRSNTETASKQQSQLQFQGKENKTASPDRCREIKSPPRRRTTASASPVLPTRPKSPDGSHADASPVTYRDVKTPPRRRTGASADPTQERGSITPSGSQTDVKQPPSKGQCWGIKKDGTRCTRKVRAVTPASPAAKSPTGTANRHISPLRSNRGASTPARSAQGTTPFDPVHVSDSEEEDTELEEVYCYQHVAEVLKVPGFFHSHSSDAHGHKNSEVYIKYDDWFGTGHLNNHAKALLRHCMSRPLSEKDQSERGHIYIHELLAWSSPSQICLKVGRSTKPFRRHGEWRVQCRSKEPLLRAIFPSTEEQGLIPGMDAPTLPGVHLSRRWERLVHLELEALGERVDVACPDCGRKHREIFMISRSEQQLGGFEMAKEVILKWMSFVEKLDSPSSAETGPF